jgi:hypothetical protein
MDGSTAHEIEGSHHPFRRLRLRLRLRAHKTVDSERQTSKSVSVWMNVRGRDARNLVCSGTSAVRELWGSVRCVCPQTKSAEHRTWASPREGQVGRRWIGRRLITSTAHEIEGSHHPFRRLRLRLRLRAHRTFTGPSRDRRGTVEGPSKDHRKTVENHQRTIERPSRDRRGTVEKPSKDRRRTMCQQSPVEPVDSFHHSKSIRPAGGGEMRGMSGRGCSVYSIAELQRHSTVVAPNPARTGFACR